MDKIKYANREKVKPDIEIYSSAHCPYCEKAKRLLQQKEVTYKEVRLDLEEPHVRVEMLNRTGGHRTVPQIFINGHWVGGYDNLWQLEQSKKLDKLLFGEN